MIPLCPLPGCGRPLEWSTVYADEGEGSELRENARLDAEDAEREGGQLTLLAS